MKISTRGRYALRLMIDLGENAGSGFVSLKDVSMRQGISVKYLEQIASFFQLDIPKLSDVQPPLPEQPLIDLNRFSGQRVEQAILSCFNPLEVDRRLRETPERFEWFRANYHYPREFQAYTIANATPQEADLLRQLGFQIQNKQQ